MSPTTQAKKKGLRRRKGRDESARTRAEGQDGRRNRSGRRDRRDGAEGSRHRQAAPRAGQSHRSGLMPKTWYGMPAYAKDGKVVCFFRDAGKFKDRYATFGFNDARSSTKAPCGRPPLR